MALAAFDRLRQFWAVGTLAALDLVARLSGDGKVPAVREGANGIRSLQAGVFCSQYLGRNDGLGHGAE